MSMHHPLDAGAVDVLFVEDNAGDVLLTNQILTEFLRPVKLTVARDGDQALMMLANDAFKPAMIILDLALPKLSGHEVLVRNPRKDIPVVVFSVSSNEAEINRTLGLGAREFVQKPMDMVGYRKAILGIVDKWVTPEEGADAAAC